MKTGAGIDIRILAENKKLTFKFWKKVVHLFEILTPKISKSRGLNPCLKNTAKYQEISKTPGKICGLWANQM